MTGNAVSLGITQLELVDIPHRVQMTESGYYIVCVLSPRYQSWTWYYPREVAVSADINTKDLPKDEMWDLFSSYNRSDIENIPFERLVSDAPDPFLEYYGSFFIGSLAMENGMFTRGVRSLSTETLVTVPVVEKILDALSQGKYEYDIELVTGKYLFEVT